VTGRPAEPEVLVPIREEADVAVARRRIRELAAAHGLGEAAAGALVTAGSEVARNIVVHAGEGEIAIRAAAEGARRGLLVVARDRGPGIDDPARALEDGYSTAGTLGIGLAGARRLVDEFELSSSPAGTTVTLTKWAP
jgi:serine/threonine-protein kinase RsbT